MPRDISSSSSEDEVDNHTTKSTLTQKETDKKTTRYQCPADFVSLCHRPCSSTLTESLKRNDNELWLIKAPASFKPECFSGIKVPLAGLKTLRVPAAVSGAQTGSSQHIYSILASTHCSSELCLLTSDKQSSNGMVFGPTFSGLLNLCESYGDSSANQAPQVIAAAPAPSIPPGLKQRFHPFGSKTPTLTCKAESEVGGATIKPSPATLHPLVMKRFSEETWQEEKSEGEDEEGRKKKKKKKKEKRIKTELIQEESLEAVRVKEEPVPEIQNEVMMELPCQEGDILEEKQKKKKKKKDREREAVEEGGVSVKVEQVTVKCEPVDTVCVDAVEGSGKKKRKKKKSRKDDD